MRVEHVAGQLAVVGLLRVHRQPRVVLHAVLRGAARLELGELPEVVLDAVAAAAIPAGPEGRLGHRDAARSAPSAGSRRSCATPCARDGRCTSRAPLLVPAVVGADARSSGRARRADRSSDRSAAAGSRISRSPGADSASSASANACILKSRAARCRVRAVEPIEKRRDLQQPGAVLDEVLVDDLGRGQRGCRALWHVHDRHEAFCAVVSARPASMVFSISMLADHQIAAESRCTSKGSPMSLEQHDGQPSAQVLLEIREPAKHAAGIGRRVEPFAERRRVDGQPEREEDVDDAPPVGVRRETRRDASRCCRGRCRSRPPRRGAAGGASAARACAPPSGRNRAGARSRARTDRPRSRCAGGGAPRSAGRPAPWRPARERRARRRCASRNSKKPRSLMSAALTASVIPPRQSRSESVDRKPKSLITANGGANVPR